jgi:UDP-glucose 4-epimerase
MAKVLITGGAGYVGSHCVKALIDAGHDCIIFDNLSRGHKEFAKWSSLIVGDVRDKGSLSQVFQDHHFDAVMHFAALAYVGESVDNPLLYWDNNVSGTRTLLEVMLGFDVKKIVFSSTCAVYGQPDTLPITEETLKQPINPYGYTKLACENLMDHLGTSSNLKSVRFRYFNAAGSDHKNGLGEWHEPETHLIPLVIDSAMGLRPPVKIFGCDFPTYDGTAIRDYIHVKDLASAHLKGLDYLLNGGSTEVFNLGSGLGTSVYDVIKVVEHISGKRVPRIISDRRKGDPAELMANVQKIKHVLGWSSKLSFEKIIDDAYQWALLRNKR